MCRQINQTEYQIWYYKNKQKKSVDVFAYTKDEAIGKATRQGICRATIFDVWRLDKLVPFPNMKKHFRKTLLN